MGDSNGFLHVSSSTPTFNSNNVKKPSKSRKSRLLRATFVSNWLRKSSDKSNLKQSTIAELSRSLEDMHQQSTADAPRRTGPGSITGLPTTTRSTVDEITAVDQPSVAGATKTSTQPGNRSQRGVRLSGWLHKWTNYLSGYRRRWFVLDYDGCLHYYRQPSEVGSVTPRGTIQMDAATIYTEAAANFIVKKQGGANNQNNAFHMKAASEVERQKWVTALELAKHRAIKAREADEEMEMQFVADESYNADSAQTDMQNTLHLMNAKTQDLLTCQDLLSRHGTTLHKALIELEHELVAAGDTRAQHRLKIINERATLFRITADAMIQACNEFVALTSNHNRRWHVTLQFEHQQRMQLQQQLEQLAKQHSVLEKVAMKQRSVSHKHSARDGSSSGKHGEDGNVKATSDSEDDSTIFHDAEDQWDEMNVYSAEEEEEKDNEESTNQRRSSSSAKNRDDGSTPSLTPTGSAVVLCADDIQKQRAATEKYLKAKIITRTGGAEQTSGDDDSDGMPTTASTPTDGASATTNDALTPLTESTSSLAHRERRVTIAAKPTHAISLWSIMRNCIGKELSKIPMPVNFNEPLSFLQRITEDIEYSRLLDRAAQKSCKAEQICYVATFMVSMYSTTSSNRATKPFNPLLGETYECDRWDDLGWRSMTEQVSHHPPVAAHHCESKMGWTLYQEFGFTSKFRGKYLSVVPTGVTHIKFGDGNHYTYRRVTTTVHNIIVGKLWIDHHGETQVVNHTNGDRCTVRFIPYSYFSKEEPRKVTACVTDSSDKIKYMVQGIWDSHMDVMKVVNADDNRKSIETMPAKRIWQKNEPPKDADKMYYLTRLALQLNEPEDYVAPTDSRLRPDQRLMENGEWDRANTEKLRLEERQRKRRRKLETEHEAALTQGRSIEEYTPAWFRKEVDDLGGEPMHKFTGDYWRTKLTHNWPPLLDIYGQDDV